MFRMRSAHGEELARRNDDVAMQSIRIELQIHFSVKRTHQVALDNHAAEPFPASNFHPRTKRFPPIELDGIVVGAVAGTPSDGHASVRHRKGPEFRCIDRKLMEREPQILRRFGLESDRRPFDRDLRGRSVKIPELRADQLAEGGPIQLSRTSRSCDAASACNRAPNWVRKLSTEPVCRAVCRAIAWITASRFFRTVCQLA